MSSGAVRQTLVQLLRPNPLAQQLVPRRSMYPYGHRLSVTPPRRHFAFPEKVCCHAAYNDHN